MKIPINEIIVSPNKIDIVKKSSVNIAMIINDLVDLYKLKRNKLILIREEINIKDLLTEINLIINFTFDIDDDVPKTIFIDIKRLKQVLLNIITNNTYIYVNATISINDDEKSDTFCHIINFNVENSDILKDERLFITKKLISLMGGFCNFTNNNLTFNIEGYKDMNSYSNFTLKRIKGKKILIIDNDTDRRLDLGNKLKQWDLDLSFASTENEGKILIEKNYDLFITNFQSLISIIDIHKPILYLVTNNEIELTPRNRKTSLSKYITLLYPIDDMKLLTIIIELF